MVVGVSVGVTVCWLDILCDTGPSSPLDPQSCAEQLACHTVDIPPTPSVLLVC